MVDSSSSAKDKLVDYIQGDHAEIDGGMKYNLAYLNFENQAQLDEFRQRSMGALAAFAMVD